VVFSQTSSQAAHDTSVGGFGENPSQFRMSVTHPDSGNQNANFRVAILTKILRGLAPSDFKEVSFATPGSEFRSNRKGDNYPRQL
jgi:hypothetical protein